MSSAASSDTGSQNFEQQWPDLARRLDTMLAGKRVPPHKRDDIVQEFLDRRIHRPGISVIEALHDPVGPDEAHLDRLLRQRVQFTAQRVDL